MNTRVDIAVWNNIAWCGLVCDTHEIAHISKEHVWGTLDKAPQFYPDIITTSKHGTVEEVMDFIGNREIASLKDSFASLDLSPLGFTVLFEAEWIYHESVTEASEPAQESWRMISTEQELARWTSVNGLEKVVKPALLQHEDVKIFTCEQNGALSGFIANVGANAVGISNVFSASQTSKNLWLDIPKVVAAEFPGLPLVGYESNGDLAAALSSGWTSVGPLRVWIK